MKINIYDILFKVIISIIIGFMLLSPHNRGKMWDIQVAINKNQASTNRIQNDINKIQNGINRDFVKEFKNKQQESK